MEKVLFTVIGFDSLIFFLGDYESCVTFFNRAFVLLLSWTEHFSKNLVKKQVMGVSWHNAGKKTNLCKTTSSLRKLELELSQAAACDELVYSVNYNGQNSGTQGYALPLFED